MLTYLCISPRCFEEPISNISSSARQRSVCVNNECIHSISSQDNLELRSTSPSNTASSVQPKKFVASIENKENAGEKNYVPCLSLDENNTSCSRNENEQDIIRAKENQQHINNNSKITSISCDICGNYFKSIYHLRNHHFICIKDNLHNYMAYDRPSPNNDVFKSLCLNGSLEKPHPRLTSETDVQLNEKSDCFVLESHVEVIKNVGFDNSFSSDAMLTKSDEKFSCNESLNQHLGIHKGKKIDLNNDEKKILVHNNSIELASDIQNVETKNVHCNNDSNSGNDISSISKPFVLEFICDICDKTFSNQANLNTHHLTHTNHKPYNYTEHVEKSSCNDNFKSHLGVPTGKKPDKYKSYTCKICSKSFQRQTRLNVHLRIHTNAREFICTLCGKGFNQKGTLKTHMLTHTGEKAHKCSFCDKKFGIKSSLNKHLKRHAGDKPHQCDICHFKFTFAVNLKEHYRIHTGELPFDCDVCQKKFSRRSTLNAHLASHTGNQRFECDVCQKKFFHKSALNSHSRIHTKERFICDICGKSYATNNALKEHYRLHTGEKPYVCSYCNKAFSMRNVYDRHILIHTGEKPYECKICKMLFNQSSSLKRHQVVHTKEKPYSCDICQKSFTQKSYLSSHKLLHSGKEIYVCKICDKSFAKKSGLMNHVCEE